MSSFEPQIDYFFFLERGADGGSSSTRWGQLQRTAGTAPGPVHGPGLANGGAAGFFFDDFLYVGDPGGPGSPRIPSRARSPIPQGCSPTPKLHITTNPASSDLSQSTALLAKLNPKQTRIKTFTVALFCLFRLLQQHQNWMVFWTQCVAHFPTISSIIVRTTSRIQQR